MAAPVIDATTTAVATGGVTSLTWSHIVDAGGASRYMVVQVATNGTNVSGVTYAGIACTLLGSSQETPTGHKIFLWGLVQPGTGTNSVVVTLAASTPVSAGAVSVTGVDQIDSVGNVATTSVASDTEIQTLVTSDADQLVIGAVVWNAVAGAALSTPDVGQTFGWKQEGGSFVRGAGSTEPGAATVTFGYSLSIATNAAIAAVPLKPALQPSKGTISRIVVPLARYDKRRYYFIREGWSRSPAFDGVQNSPTDVFVSFIMG